MSRGRIQSHATDDALELERQRFGSVKESPQDTLSSKRGMQQLYRQQLDSLLQEKQRLKLVQRNQKEAQKRQFNEQAQQSKQAQKMKQLSYKNYYNMLMNSQSNNQQQFVSPFSKGDSLKDSLINKNIEDERNRRLAGEKDLNKRDLEKKNIYRNELMQQIQERRRYQQQRKNQELQEKQAYQKQTKVPQEVSQYQKEKHREQMLKYKADLDMLRNSSSHQQQNRISLADSRPQCHNTLTNPMPYNIQNPYILKQMGLQKNPSYLAMKGSQNLKLS